MGSRSDFWRQFWDIVCDYDDLMKVGLGALFLLGSLLLLALPGIPRGSSSFVILIMNLTILVPLIGVMLILIWRCQHRTRERRF